MWRWCLSFALVLVLGVLGLILWPSDAPQIADRPLPEGVQARDELVIVTFGTSLTARNTWPERLAETLQTCLGIPVRLNREAGVGQGSDWALEHLDMVVRHNPHLVLIEFAINDADFLDGVSLRRSVAQHDHLLTELHLRLPEAAVLLMTMNPAEGLRGLKRPRLHAYYAAYVQLAEMHDTGLADFYPRWLEGAGGAEWSNDGLHPTDTASDLVILPVLQGMIGTATGVTCDSPVDRL